MIQKSLPVEQILVLLSAAPQKIKGFTAGLSAAQLLATPIRHEWSINEVLAHLRSCADVWGKCIETIINEDTPTIHAVNPRTWIKLTNYPKQDFLSSLASFTEQ